MIRCIYCSHVTEAPEKGFPDKCPECFTAMKEGDWEWIDEE